MTEPLQGDLLTRRFRKVKAPEPSELQIQIALMQHFNLRGRPDAIGYAVPNGELRDKRTAAKLKAMGVLPGVADLTFEWPELVSVVGVPEVQIFPRVLHLELKTRRGRLSEAQHAFAARARRVGAAFEVADNIDDAIAILERYGLLR